MQKKKGVSLIVLSITILVMAILAATAIIALEDSGIIGRSKNTTAKQNYTEEYTRLQVIKNGILTDNLGEITVDEYITELTNKGLIESGVTTNSDGSKSVTTKTGFVANIIQDGESNLIISLGEANSAISLSPVTLTGDITDGQITKTITATTKNVSGDISWTTSNASVATVTGTNSGATVTLKGVGTATITATYGNAKASCEVTVTGTVATPTITLDKTTITKTIDSGSTATETITATTQNISGTLTWTTANTSVATVSANGNTATVTMKAGGTAIITATYGSTSASCTVVVTENEVTSTATITSSTMAETQIDTGSAPDTVPLSFTTVLNKSNANQSLTLKYKFYGIDDGTQEIIYDEGSDYAVTTSASTVTTNIDFIPFYTSWGWGWQKYIVVIEVMDADGNILATHTLNNHTYGEVYADYYSFYITFTCMPAGTLILVEEEYEDENGKKKKRRKKKKIEDITYDDDLVVWDFDNACFTTAKPLWIKEKEFANKYNILKFSDGTELKTVQQHRIFNKDLGRFTCPFSADTPDGTTTFNANGEEVKLVSQERVEGYVEYHNIVTKYHMNIFAEGILTSCRLSNLYEIKDMKYVKDDRELVDIEEFNGIPEEYIEGLRLREQPRDINRGIANTHGNTVKDYVKNMLIKAKKK